MAEEKAQDRRSFLLDSLKGLGRMLAQSVSSAVEGTAGGTRYIRPPGAVDEAEFLLICNRCGDCARVCPEFAVKFLPPTAGTAVGTPYIEPGERGCTLCGKCIPACVPGALTPVADMRQVRIGEARLDQERCLAHQGEACSLCYGRCPYPDQVLQLREGHPVILPEACTGCGLCAAFCPTTPKAIVVEPVSPAREGF
ncbi:MAG: 4Fe-4S dicluster domain-containing protein [Mycobacterium leprae]